jgi:23S rRNA-/tRNA-specific pseudouridylate synthase
VCGHLAQDEGEIVFPLQRDHKLPPWMRVSTKESEKEAAEVVKDLQHAGWKKMIRKAPKQSETRYKVMSREYFEGEPITRLALTPVTGR